MAAMTRRAPAVLLLLAACDADPVAPLSSAELSAGAITLSATLRSNGGVAQILASPLHEQQIVELTGGDALLFASAGGPEQPLTRFEGSYLGQLSTEAVDFDLIFARGGGARIVSAITLPPSFALTAPAAPVSRADPIPIAWDPPDGPRGVVLEIRGPCLTQPVVRPFEVDTGAYDIQPADLFVVAGTDACDLEVTVTRWGAAQDLAPELAPASRASVQQIRTVAIATMP
jgi:hypothetical protein